MDIQATAKQSIKYDQQLLVKEKAEKIVTFIIFQCKEVGAIVFLSP